MNTIKSKTVHIKGVKTAILLEFANNVHKLMNIYYTMIKHENMTISISQRQ